MMRFAAFNIRRRLFLGLVAICCGYWVAESTAWAKSESATKGKQLSISLPEVVVELPSIEHLIAARVRPIPPKRLGVRLPVVFVAPQIPSIRLPLRPIPSEKKSDLDLMQLLGDLSGDFIDESEQFDAAHAYLQKNSPIEALSLFDGLAKKTKLHFWRAASLFWAGETLLSLRRTQDARERREDLLKLLLTDGFRYVSAARYALAQERCEARDYEGCLSLLEGQSWEKGKLAYEEAIFLKGWAQAKAGSVDEALKTWTILANPKGRLTFQALVTLGHFYLQRRNYAQAEKRYAAAEALGLERGKLNNVLLGEALYGIGWTRLFLGRMEGAKRAFSRFMRRHQQHPLKVFVQAGLISTEIESIQKPHERLNKLRARLLGFSRVNRRKMLSGALRLQLAWKLFRIGVYEEASILAGKVSDEFPLGRIYRIARIVEGLSQYHLGKVKRAYGILRLGADYPPVSVHRLAEQDAARSAAMATAFAAFRLSDFKGALNVLKHWAFLPERGSAISPDGLAMLWYGEAAFELGNLDEAALAFRAVPRQTPEYYRALGGLAWVQYRRKNWRKAALAFGRVFEHKPGGVLAAEALARAGEARFNLRNYDGALQSFERIEKKYRGSDVAKEALYQKAKLLFRRSRFDAAEKNFHAFLKRYPKSKTVAEVKYNLALIPFRKGQYSLARKKLLGFLESHRDSSLAGDGYLRLADSSYNEGRYREANRLYRLMMNGYPSHPKFSEAVYGRLLSHLQLGEYANFLSGAREYIDRYTESNLSISLAFQIGEVLLTQRNRVEALKAYKEVIAQYPKNELAAHALLRVAGIHRSKKDIDKALDSYETLLSRYPAVSFHADGLFGVGETLAGIGRCTEAKQKLTDFLEVYPSHDYEMLARFALGRCMVRLREYDGALTHLKTIMSNEFAAGVDLRSQSALLVAELYRKRKKYADAERALSIAVEFGALELAAEAFFAHARISSERKGPKAAAEYLKLTYRYPDQKIWVARALGRAGELYEKAGNRTLALRIYQKMRKVVEDPAFKRKARIAIRRITKQIKKRSRR